MTTPMLIRGGKTYPVTAAQVDLARRGQPIGPVAGLDATARAPLAAAPARASTARERGADGLTVGQRSMLKVIEMRDGRAARAKAEARLGIRAA